jgi:hypothetical protein
MLKPDASRPDLGPTNVGPQSIVPMYADENWRNKIWYEAPREDPEWPEVHTYTDAISYEPGQTVVFHGSTTAQTWSIQIYRDGYKPTLAHRADAMPGQFTAAPKDACKAGCDWPVVHRWTIPGDTPSGFYRVISSCLRKDGTPFVQHHFFVVRPTPATRRGRILMILPTATWTSYNDWGGASHYIGVDGPTRNQFSPVLSLLRPWTRGAVWLPEGAPRIPISPQPGPLAAPRYPIKEWSYTHGFGYYYAASGWAQYDRYFVQWAEREGYAFDMITQTDLHFRPEMIADYPCIVIVGHDEYWSHEMRTTIERHVEQGGNLARFGGNFCWQIRLEENGLQQVCYKGRAATEDPVRGTKDARLLTSSWEDPKVNWPGATTVGVNGFGGIYASWGGFAPRGQRGFTVYRPAHWIFDKTDLHYGDIFGSEAGIFGYELDGLDYTFRRGLPYPTGSDGAPESVQILGMAPASNAEVEHAGEGFRYYLRDKDLMGIASTLDGSTSGENLDKRRYGSGMMVHMTRGKGEVVTAGSCEWIMGLKLNDFYTQQITRNVLDKFSAE